MKTLEQKTIDLIDAIKHAKDEELSKAGVVVIYCADDHENEDRVQIQSAVRGTTGHLALAVKTIIERHKPLLERAMIRHSIEMLLSRRAAHDMQEN